MKALDTWSIQGALAHDMQTKNNKFENRTLGPPQLPGRAKAAKSSASRTLSTFTTLHLVAPLSATQNVLHPIVKAANVVLERGLA